MDPDLPLAAAPEDNTKLPELPDAAVPDDRVNAPESPLSKDSPDESVTEPECFVAVVEIPDCKTNEPEFESEFPLFNVNSPLL
jgi:hypothetical protein